MAGFEELIRDTLARQGEPTHANRARVYASARSALERMIGRNEAEGNADADAAQAQREHLEAAIERIEDEHLARLAEPAPAPEPTPAAVTTPPPPPVPEARPEPTAPPPPASPPVAPPPEVAPEPRASEPVPMEEEPSEPEAPAPPPTRREARRTARLLDTEPRRRPWARLLLWAIILAGLASAAWWAWTFGPDYARTLGPTAPQPVETTLDTDAADAGWISVFDPAEDIGAVVAGEAAQSRIVEDGSRTWLRLASSSDPDEAASRQVSIRVPPGVLATLAGTRATFEVTVRTAPGGAPHPFSLSCEIEGATCNRTRFDAQTAPQPFVFAADLTGAGETGSLVFDTDLEGGGRAIDLGAIRVSRE